MRPRGDSRTKVLADVEKLVDAVTVDGPDTDDVLDDLKLTKRLRQRLCPLLKELGFTVAEAERCDEFHVSCKQVEVAQRDWLELVLIHIPKVVLSTVNAPNVQAVAFLEYVLNPGDRVVILSDGLRDQPAPPYRRIWSLWTGKGVSAAFVPSSDLKFLANKPDGERARELALILELALGAVVHDRGSMSTAPGGSSGGNDASVPAAGDGAGPDVRLEEPEIELFQNVLREQVYGAGVEPQIWFNDLVSRTGVGDEAASKLTGMWTGNLPIDARRLVLWAKARNSFPPDHERAGEAILGVLVELMAHETFSSNLQELGRIVVRRRLLSVEATKELSAKLRLDESESP